MLVMCTLLPALLAISGAAGVLAVRAALRRRGRGRDPRRLAPDRRARGLAAAAGVDRGVLLLVVMALGLLIFNTDLTTGNGFRDEESSTRGQELVARAFPAGANAPNTVLVPNPDKPRGCGPRCRGGRGRPAADPSRPARRAHASTSCCAPTPTRRRRSTRFRPASAGRGGRRRRRADRRADGRGARPARVGRARHEGDRAARAPGRVRRARGPAPRRAAARPADRHRRAVVPRGAGSGRLLLRVRLRLPGVGPVAAAVGVRVPGRARDRLQHLPDGARARGGAAARHAARDAARPGGHRRRDHVGGDRAGRHLQRRSRRCRSCSSPSSAS